MRDRLLRIDPLDYRGVIWSKEQVAEQILEWFDWADAGWAHDGNSKNPHAVLTSGKCSNGYFNCSKVFSCPNICATLADQLAHRISINETDWVVSSSYAAITFGHEVAKAFGAQFGFTEKDPQNPKKQIWKRFSIPEGSNVLQVEELITTSGTFKEVRRAITERNPEPVNFFPIIATLIHRPENLPMSYKIGSKKNETVQIEALIEKEVWAVEQKDCPLCEAGSKRLSPKSHWAELTGKK
ncbi:hypothetical protein KKC65_01190 [Patescibacteria group bacterium]|nr:hypothetical protein [Patescibacteria group bacterium]